MEQRLIDANELLAIYKNWLPQLTKPEDAGDRNGVETCIAVLEEAPTIDAAPVVHGRWVKAHGMMPPEYHGRKCCSVCDAFALRDFHGREQLSAYCPSCGAKMDLE